MRRQDWHSDKAVFITLMQVRWQAGGFTAEDEDDIGRFTERHVPEESLRLRREKVRSAESRKLFLERIPAWPHARIDMLPVVESGSLYLTFIQRKAQRFDEVQIGTGGKTCTARVSGVPVNLGMHEYNVRCQWSLASFLGFQHLRMVLADLLGMTNFVGAEKCDPLVGRHQSEPWMRMRDR